MVLKITIKDKKIITFSSEKETIDLNIEENNIEPFNRLLDSIISNIDDVRIEKKYEEEINKIQVEIANAIVQVLEKEINEIREEKKKLFAKIEESQNNN